MIALWIGMAACIAILLFVFYERSFDKFHRKKIYQLNRIEGLSYEEIAQTLNISKSTVSNQLVEATKFIREYVKGAGGATVAVVIVQWPG